MSPVRDGTANTLMLGENTPYASHGRRRGSAPSKAHNWYDFDDASPLFQNPSRPLKKDSITGNAYPKELK